MTYENEHDVSAGGFMSVKSNAIVTETYCRCMESKGKDTELCMASGALVLSIRHFLDASQIAVIAPSHFLCSPQHSSLIPPRTIMRG
jgi:hypothetical protein